jgi:hypothetical protein
VGNPLKLAEIKDKDARYRRMRAVIQRVRSCRVTIGSRTTGEIGPGLLVLLGVGKSAPIIWRRRCWACESSKMTPKK